jgi:uncharacterized integral membrane protein
MLRLISWFLMIPVAVAVVLLSVANREDVTVSLAPLPAAFVLPLPVVILGAVALGFLWGALAAWISAARHRRLASRYRYRVEQAERDAKRLGDKIAKMEAAPTAFAKPLSKIPAKIPAKSLPPPGSADAA